jgi:hypothetical protein
MLVAASPAGGIPPTGELTRLLLTVTVDSYEIAINWRATGGLQCLRRRGLQPDQSDP